MSKWPVPSLPGSPVAGIQFFESLDDEWHDGPGFYYVFDDYPDEGACGAFSTYAEAVAHARYTQEETDEDPKQRPVG